MESFPAPKAPPPAATVGRRMRRYNIRLYPTPGRRTSPTFGRGRRENLESGGDVTGWNFRAGFVEDEPTLPG